MRIIFLVIFLLATYFTKAQLTIINKQFYFTGKISGQKNGIVSLSYINSEGKQVRDSCLLHYGNFSFKGKIIEPTLATLKGTIKSIADDDPNSASFYLEPGNITAIVEKNNFKKIKVTGSKTQKEFEMLQKKYDAITDGSDSAYEKFSVINNDFIITYPNSYVSSFLLVLYATRWPLDSIRMLFSRLSPSIQKSFYGKKVLESINEIDNNTTGKVSKPFTAIDINGASISLSNFKGKYVLLDFWASWCVPCREGTPQLIQLFKKYHKKGLEIIGISDDYNTEAWKIAVEKDSISIWYNILSGANLQTEIDDTSQINKKYGVQVLPTKFLIDRTGMIIGRYTGTDEEPALAEKLKAIFK